MGMDGLYRPAQALGYTDPLGHLNASDMAAMRSRQSNQVNQNEEVQPVGEEQDNNNEEQNKDKQEKEDNNTFAEELKELLTLQFNLELDPDKVYRFNFNKLTERFELIDTSINVVLLSILPEDFFKITDNIHHNSGIISNRIA